MRSSVSMLGLITGIAGLGTLVALGGCGFSSPACEPLTSQLDLCPFAAGNDLTLSGMVDYDTGTHELRVNAAPMPVMHMTLTSKAGEVNAILANHVRFTAGARLRATGPLPFAIVASGSITLEDGAAIDVSNGGAGALPMCANPPMPGDDSTGGGAGGGGGAYGAAGGGGGDGNGNANGQPAVKTNGGAEGNSIAMPMGPMGGCPGARGGTGGWYGDTSGRGGPGGPGGGALYLFAADRIEFGNGAVLMAGGGGGRGGGQNGGSSNSGGGGGGSGGMIVLESPHVIGPQALIVANGGGGGEGADVDSNGAPHSGNNGESGLASTSRAPGGAGGAQKGTDGGHGGSLETPAGEVVTAVLDSGGGGGGGGVGYIHIVSLDVHLGVVSPAAN